jgi:hypothetical protein
VTGDSEKKYWYNLTTGKVEHGFVSPHVDRAGPFDTAEEAARAPEIIRERSRAWAEEDRRDSAPDPTGSNEATRRTSLEDDQN